MKAFKFAICATVVSAVIGLSAPAFASQAWERQNDNAQSYGTQQHYVPAKEMKKECAKKEHKCKHKMHHHKKEAEKKAEAKKAEMKK
ncbi:MAG: hypothetical protein PW788_02960 [Micavibrio sp.]|nr:hypothetical protein [Micavibrio sp.]